MMKILPILGACALGSLLAPDTGNAATITFSDLPSGNCNFIGGGPVSSGGYTFSGNPADSNMFVCNANQVAQNTSAALINANLRSIITMTSASGGAFDLQSFDAGSRALYQNVTQPYPLRASTGISIEGFFNGGLVASTSVVFTDLNFSTFNLGDAFNNLTAARFTALGVGETPEFIIDNINVGAAVPSAVPEPSTWAILVLSFGFLGGAMRARKVMQKPSFI